MTVDGKVFPICAVYMSINDSNTKVEDQVPPSLLPPAVPNDLLFPDLRAQPWFNNGSADAVAFANALVDTGVWTINGVDFVFKQDGGCSNPYPAPAQCGLLVNKQLQAPNNPNDIKSNPVPYFLWKASEGPGNTDGKARQVYLQQPFGTGDWKQNDAPNLDPAQKVWYWVLDAPGTDVPGPLPLFGAGAAYGWSRRLRKRIRQGC